MKSIDLLICNKDQENRPTSLVHVFLLNCGLLHCFKTTHCDFLVIMLTFYKLTAIKTYYWFIVGKAPFKVILLEKEFSHTIKLIVRGFKHEAVLRHLKHNILWTKLFCCCSCSCNFDNQNYLSQGSFYYKCWDTTIIEENRIWQLPKAYL